MHNGKIAKIPAQGGDFASWNRWGSSQEWLRKELPIIIRLVYCF
jgi:hypothetical protein